MLSTQIRLWTVSEYYQMAKLGLLHPSEKVELLEGLVIKMSPQGPLHAATNDYTTDLWRELLAGKALVRSEKPVRLNDQSEPVPDLAIVKLHPRRYADRHPNSNDIYWLIEVADSSLDYDRNTKSKIYAESSINEYWVLDVVLRQLHVYRQPLNHTYQSEIIVAENQVISPIAFPEILVNISQMLPPN